MKFGKTIVSVFTVATMIVSLVNVVTFADNTGNQYKADINKILNSNENIECEIAVQEDGEYELHITFDTINEATQRVEYSVKVDGNYPFEGADLLEAPVVY